MRPELGRYDIGSVAGGALERQPMTLARESFPTAEDDPVACSAGPAVVARHNALVVRLLVTELLSIRINLHL